MTSPISLGFTPVRSTVARNSVASKSSAGVFANPPFLARVIGVRSAEMMTTSSGDLAEADAVRCAYEYHASTRG